MLEIKTVIHQTGDPETFDRRVNAALADGWELVKRDVLPESETRQRCFYAELERGRPKKEAELDPAAWIVHRTPDNSTWGKCSACGTLIATSGRLLPSICHSCRRPMTLPELVMT